MCALECPLFQSPSPLGWFWRSPGSVQDPEICRQSFKTRSQNDGFRTLLKVSEMCALECLSSYSSVKMNYRVGALIQFSMFYIYIYICMYIYIIIILIILNNCKPFGAPADPIRPQRLQKKSQTASKSFLERRRASERL